MAKDCRAKQVHFLEEEDENAGDSGGGTQPSGEPEGEIDAPLGGLWLGALTMEQEIAALEDQSSTISFGVDSGAAQTVITQEEASDYPMLHTEPRQRMRDCQGNLVKDMGHKDLAMRSNGNLSFVRATVAPVAKNLLSVHGLVKSGHEVVFKPSGCYIKHVKTGRTKQMKEVNGVYEVDYDLVNFAEAPRPPPRG